MRIKRFVLCCSAFAALLGLLQFSNPNVVRSSGRSLLQIYTSGTETLSISSDGTITSSGTFTISGLTERVSNAAKRVKEHAQTVKEHVEKRLETVKGDVKQHMESMKEHVEEHMESMKERMQHIKERADHCAKALGAHAGHLKQRTDLLLHRLTAVHAKPIKQQQGVATTDQPAEPNQSDSVEQTPKPPTAAEEETLEAVGYDTRSVVFIVLFSFGVILAVFMFVSLVGMFVGWLINAQRDPLLQMYQMQGVGSEDQV